MRKSGAVCSTTLVLLPRAKCLSALAFSLPRRRLTQNNSWQAAPGDTAGAGSLQHRRQLSGEDDECTDSGSIA